MRNKLIDFIYLNLGFENFDPPTIATQVVLFPPLGLLQPRLPLASFETFARKAADLSLDRDLDQEGYVESKIQCKF